MGAAERTGAEDTMGAEDTTGAEDIMGAEERTGAEDTMGTWKDGDWVNEESCMLASAVVTKEEEAAAAWVPFSDTDCDAEFLSDWSEGLTWRRSLARLFWNHT